MATGNYIDGRRKWGRPQAMLWSNNAGTIDSGLFVPLGTEGTDFIICSDHNRGDISLSTQRLGNRTRMVNGTMRSYHTADKMNLSTDWKNLPSRSYSDAVTYDSIGLDVIPDGVSSYTADGGAGGVQMLDWYSSHVGPTYVFLSYDRYDKFETDPYDHLSQYSQIFHMFFSSFEYSVIKRGATNHDLWNVSTSMEEV